MAGWTAEFYFNYLWIHIEKREQQEKPSNKKTLIFL
jgi:hypothetical protein